MRTGQRALIIAWHRYHPHSGDTYRVLWENWLQRFADWGDEIDAFYLLDSDMNFTDEDRLALEKICPKVVIIKKEEEGHHWVQFRTVLPHVTEKYLFFLDNDVVMNKGIMENWFSALETGSDFVGSFDGSGGLQEQVRSKFPILKQFESNRMGTYYFGITRTLLDKINFYEWAPTQYPVGTYIPELDYTTVEGDWSDSFGYFSIKMLGLNPKISVILDPRQSIYLQDDGTILKDPESYIDLGYYHIRNGNLANYIITSFEAGNMSDYNRELSSVKRELLRSLAWFDYMDKDKHKTMVYQIVRDTGKTEAQWEEYMKEFREYHNL